MSALDFEMVRYGISPRYRESFLELERIEKLQGELVAALEGLLDCCDKADPEQAIWPQPMRKAHEALAKAHGEQP